jgi:hypothetical protein
LEFWHPVGTETLIGNSGLVGHGVGHSRIPAARHSACRRRVGPQRRLSRTGRRWPSSSMECRRPHDHPVPTSAPARRAHVPQGRAARTDPAPATAHGRRLLRDLTAPRRGDRRRQRATPGAVQRPRPGSVLDELRRVLRRSRRRACTVCCWRSRARRSRGRRGAGAAVAVQEATRMGGTGPLQRSYEATSRRAPPGHTPIGERTDSFVPATEEPFLLESTLEHRARCLVLGKLATMADHRLIVPPKEH